MRWISRPCRTSSSSARRVTAWVEYRKTKGFPVLAGLNEQFIVRQLRDFRSGKRRHGEMHDMGSRLTDEEMKAVAQYFAKLAH